MHEVYTVRGNVNYLDFSFMTRLVDNKRQLELSYRNDVAEMWDGWPAQRVLGLKNRFLEIGKAPRDQTKEKKSRKPNNRLQKLKKKPQH